MLLFHLQVFLRQISGESSNLSSDFLKSNSKDFYKLIYHFRQIIFLIIQLWPKKDPGFTSGRQISLDLDKTNIYIENCQNYLNNLEVKLYSALEENNSKGGNKVVQFDEPLVSRYKN